MHRSALGVVLLYNLHFGNATLLKVRDLNTFSTTDYTYHY